MMDAASGAPSTSATGFVLFPIFALIFLVILTLAIVFQVIICRKNHKAGLFLPVFFLVFSIIISFALFFINALLMILGFVITNIFTIILFAIYVFKSKPKKINEMNKINIDDLD